MTPTALAPVIALRPAPPARPALDDAELVRRAREGLVAAQAELFRRHAPALTALLTRLLASSTEAEDAVQDSFMIALRDLHQLREPAAVGGWLRQVAVHQAHRRFRRRRWWAALGMDRSVQDATLQQLVDPDATPDLRAELALVDRLLGRLPTAERMAWMLRIVEGYELKEVAEMCACSLATAKRRIAAAQKTLAAHLELPEVADGE